MAVQSGRWGTPEPQSDVYYLSDFGVSGFEVVVDAESSFGLAELDVDGDGADDPGFL